MGYGSQQLSRSLREEADRKWLLFPHCQAQYFLIFVMLFWASFPRFTPLIFPFPTTLPSASSFHDEILELIMLFFSPLLFLISPRLNFSPHPLYFETKSHFKLALNSQSSSWLSPSSAVTYLAQLSSSTIIGNESLEGLSLVSLFFLPMSNSLTSSTTTASQTAMCTTSNLFPFQFIWNYCYDKAVWGCDEHWSGIPHKLPAHIGTP